MTSVLKFCAHTPRTNIVHPGNLPGNFSELPRLPLFDIPGRSEKRAGERQLKPRFLQPGFSP